jgi:hypothetical protein
MSSRPDILGSRWPLDRRRGPCIDCDGRGTVCGLRQTKRLYDNAETDSDSQRLPLINQHD